MNPICETCHKLMRISGSLVVELMSRGRSDQIHYVNRYVCEDCASQILVSTENEPIAESHQSLYKTVRAREYRLGPVLQIKE